MTSSIAWLDTSADEQRRIRELIALFTQRESRDELGIGQIRDVFSDTLFPGTSVIQTRARYFLIIPWVFTVAARHGRSGQYVLAHATNTERRLIELLRDAGQVDGLIGRLAGKNVKILPSTIYWSGLQTYGILIADKAPDGLAEVIVRRADDTDELATRQFGDWDPTLPPPPLGFPRDLSNGLDLQADEAEWLRERIKSAVPGTLLAHLLTIAQAPDSDSSAPWNDTAAATAPDDVRELVQHAELFSLAMHGAALLYNLQIGQRYEDAGHTRIPNPVQTYRDVYADWSQEVSARAPAIGVWDRQQFWAHIRVRNPRISGPTRSFVDNWVDAVLDGRTANGLEDSSLRGLVARRERQIKKSQSRLTNDKLLGAWSGESGSARLVYRWPQVRRIVTDIQRARSTDAGT